ncbi:hypothetical protein C0J52_20623, partial [Blattella germanica]
ESVIRTVVESGSKIGKWLRSLLQVGKKIPSHIAFSLVLQRLNDHELHHYGYILTGIPFYGKDEKDPSPAQQLGQIFSLHLKPDILIYVKFPDEDVIHKRNQQRFDPSSDTYISKEMEDIGRKVRFLYMHGKDHEQHGDIAEILQEFDSIIREKLLILPVNRPFMPIKMLPELVQLSATIDDTLKHEEEEEEEEEEIHHVEEEELFEEDEIITKPLNEEDVEDEIKVEDLEGLELDEEALKEISKELEEEEEMENLEPNLEEVFKSKCKKFYGSEELIKENEGSIDDDDDDPVAFYRNKTPPEVFTTLQKKDAIGGRFK